MPVTGKRAKGAKTAAVRLTPEDQAIVERLRAKFGVDFSSVVKMAIRVLEEQQNRRDVAAD